VAALLAIPALFVAVILVLPSTAQVLYGVSRGDDAASG
jgi:hypothetical protein